MFTYSFSLHDSVFMRLKRFISAKMSSLINVRMRKKSFFSNRAQIAWHLNEQLYLVWVELNEEKNNNRLVTKNYNLRNHLGWWRLQLGNTIWLRIVIQLRRNPIETWHNTIVINEMFSLYIKTRQTPDDKIIQRTRFIWIP